MSQSKIARYVAFVLSKGEDYRKNQDEDWKPIFRKYQDLIMSDPEASAHDWENSNYFKNLSVATKAIPEAKTSEDDYLALIELDDYGIVKW